MQKKENRKPFSFRRPKRPKRPDESWFRYILDLFKKAWESTFVKVLTTILFAGSAFLYYNFFQNPKIDFTLRVEVIDYVSKEGIDGAALFIQDRPDTFSTNSRGIAEKTFRLRLKQEKIELTCAAEGYEPREKLIEIPLEAPRVFHTDFVLVPK